MAKERSLRERESLTQYDTFHNDSKLMYLPPFFPIFPAYGMAIPVYSAAGFLLLAGTTSSRGPGGLSGRGK